MEEPRDGDDEVTADMTVSDRIIQSGVPQPNMVPSEFVDLAFQKPSRISYCAI